MGETDSAKDIHQTYFITTMYGKVRRASSADKHFIFDFNFDQIFWGMDDSRIQASLGERVTARSPLSTGSS
jgi:hypothetical protein